MVLLFALEGSKIDQTDTMLNVILENKTVEN